MTALPLVPLRTVLAKSEEWIKLDPMASYKQVTVKMWGQGVIERNTVQGRQIGSESRLVVRPNQFLISRIDARNGASGIVPPVLDGAVVSNDFPAFTIDSDRMDVQFFGWYSKTADFVANCKSASEGSTNRVRLKEDRFLSMLVPLPSLAEQRCTVEKIEAVLGRVRDVGLLLSELDQEINSVLRSVFQGAIEGAVWLPMSKVAPLVRRPVEIDPLVAYPELGIRSFGKGSFHKPPLEGSAVGSKKLFRIEEGDLVFNIVFAWEGAVAVATADDNGRFGSHRFLSCVADRTMALPEFLCFHFSTDCGLEQLGQASPGGAGRNRTLGIDNLARITVPVPTIATQQRFVDLLRRFDERLRLREAIAVEVAALGRSFLNRAFSGY